MASAENSVSEPPPPPPPLQGSCLRQIMPPFTKFLATALNLQQALTKTSLENLDISKPQPYKYFVVYWTEEIQAKTEE